ncbi:MAG: divergent PAP2 family protein [Candidatus Woesearchaeota archaeon]
MNIITDILLNYYVLAFAIAWILSILFKTITAAVDKKKSLSIIDGLTNGGMPSSHSTVVSAITAAIFINQGATPLFFVSLVFALIVIGDACRLRLYIGHQGDALNTLLIKAKERPLNVVYGHTILQVVAGILLGVMVAGVVYIVV